MGIFDRFRRKRESRDVRADDNLRMDLQSLKRKFGIERYNAACKEARKAAQYCGRTDRVSPAEAMYALKLAGKSIHPQGPHARELAAVEDRRQLVGDLSDEVWNSSLSVEKKLDLIFEIYEEMPEHYLLFDIWIQCGRKSETVTKYVSAKYRKYLSGKDKALARPAAYNLWCGVFEHDLKQCDQAWHFLLKKPWNDQLIENLLEVSGPVPYRLKRQLYDELLPDKKWHIPIARSIAFSMTDVCGDVDLKDAKKVFSKLMISKNLDSGNLKIIEFLRKELRKSA